MSITTFKDAPELLRHDELDEDIVRHLLKPAGFSGYQAAYRAFKRMVQPPETQAALAEALPQILLALSATANPDQVLVNFERFIQNASDQKEILHDFVQNPRPLEILVRLFEGSQFLTDILVRHPHYFSRLTAHHRLAEPKSVAQLRNEAQATIAPLLNGQRPIDPAPLLDALRRFQRWELLRIGTSDLLGSFDLTTVTSQLSYLADSLIQTGLFVAAELAETPVDDFFVLAMGKLGGQELNYSSDIDLLFIAQSKPTKHMRLGQQLIEILNRTTAEGFLYRVDMRLRPWGRSGSLVSSVDGYLGYLEKHAGLWEKQALLKARVMAGNMTLGQKFLERIQPFLFQTDPQTVRTEIHTLKQRIETKLKRQGQQWGEVKLGEGSIRDIEFVTQAEQLIHGDAHPHIRSANTLDALSLLHDEEILSAEAYRVLVGGYTFLRTVEHHLQLMHYQQTHKLPDSPQALDHLARRLGFQGTEAGTNFMARYEQHSAAIRVIYQRHLGDEQDEEAAADRPKPATPDILPHLTRMPPTYVTAFKDREIKHHAEVVETLDEAHPIRVEAKHLKDNVWQVTIIGPDYVGMVSLICGLLFVHGFNIIDGQIFSYGRDTEPVPAATPPPKPRRRRSVDLSAGESKETPQKIVDVFTVTPTEGRPTSQDWAHYAQSLTQLVRNLRDGQQHEAHGELAKRAGQVLRGAGELPKTLYPIDIDIDNDASERHTVLRIDAPDTVGFLYELTNALALTGINIRRMIVASSHNRVQDTLYVIDSHGHKITAADKQHELRVATALIKHFTHLLPHSPNPELALNHFREFVGHLFNQPNWTQDLASLERPEVLNTLARLLGVSDFLWSDFLRMQHTNLFPILENVEALPISKSKSDLRAEVAALMQTNANNLAQREALNAFKDREMFRIDMRQIQGHTDELTQFSNELTDLAEVVVEAAQRIAASVLRSHFGLPRLDNRHVCNLSICALGKFGGREMGFASDIELMFIYNGSGRTTGPRVIANNEFFNRLVAEVEQIIQTRREGVFELDLQLRPYGKAGSLGVSLEAFERYFVPGGPAWPYERQALVRLRPIAGDLKLGQQIVQLRDQFVYADRTFDVAAMRAMRERQIRHNVTAGTINAKLSSGGLVDVEYLVQGLQVMHGQDNPNLRITNTAAAMTALNAAGILATDDYAPLRDAHIFLRRLINALRMVRGNAKDLTVPPADSEEFAFLARRLGYELDQLPQLWRDLVHHTSVVQEINTRQLG